jgi:excisionase family DNA binding protein
MVFLTTSEAAKALGVCPKTVCNWIDSRELPGFRVPGSLHRRVSEEEVWRFTAKHNIPSDGVLAVLSKKTHPKTPASSLNPVYQDEQLL